MDKRALVVIFEDLPDPRVARTRVHLLAEVLVIAVLAVLAGGDGWDETVEWAKVRESWLRTFMSLPGGIPSADTVRRIFCAIAPAKFAACFERIITELAGSMLDQLVAIDGKTMRRSFSRRGGQRPLHMVSAWVAERGVHLGQIATDAKSNEITAIPALLDIIDVRGATVSIDAEGSEGEDARAACKESVMLRIYPVLLQLVRLVRPLVKELERCDADLARQCRRALCSAPLNVAEGSYSRGKNRAARYHTALGSLREVLACLEVQGWRARSDRRDPKP